MNHRKLRFAWSMAWGVAALLLMVLWVRSYATIYWCYGLPNNGRVAHLQIAGGLVLLFYRDEAPSWEAGSVPRKYAGEELVRPYTGFENPNTMSIRALSGEQLARLPMWLVSAAFIVCAIFPWAVPRFGLRTLLIAMTLVAIALGLIVWL